MGFVEDGYESAPAAYRAMAGDFLDLHALDGHVNVVLSDVVRGGLFGVVVKNVRRQSCVQKSREVGAVVGVDARFAANHRHSTGGARARHVVGEVKVKKFAARGRPSGFAFAGEGPTANILNGSVQLNESFALRTLASVSALARCRMVAAVL